MHQKRRERRLFRGILLLVSIAGILSGCGRTESNLHAEGRAAGKELSIRGDVQWGDCLDWKYQPNHGQDGAEGWFLPVGSAKGEGKREDCRIEVYSYEMSEDEFFSCVNGQAAELAERYDDRETVFRVNGNTEIEQFVQLDVFEEHWLYLRQGDTVYTLSGRMETEKWQAFLQDWLLHAEADWGGRLLMGQEGTVTDGYTGYRTEGLRETFQYNGNDFLIRGTLLRCVHTEENGFYLQIDKGEDIIEDVFFCPAEKLPDYENGGEVLNWFQERYPDMETFEAIFWGETPWQSLKEASKDNVFYRLEDAEGSHGFFVSDGKPCEVVSRSADGIYTDMVYDVQRGAGYDYDPFFFWQKDADGSVRMADEVEERSILTQDIGGGERLLLEADLAEVISGELDERCYALKIYEEEGKRLLQELEVFSAYYCVDMPFSFEDFNADGYLDLTVLYYYGANGGSASHYLWSPSQRRFVKVSTELNYFGGYGVDPETRRLYMHYHGSAISGTEVTYQWQNEMDYEMIKSFDHDSVEQGEKVQVNIVRYEDGKQEILSDYAYSREEYAERISEIWGTYEEDFVWEQEIADEEEGRKYILRYAQVPCEEEYQSQWCTKAYQGRLYVYDEETYLIRVLYSEITDPYSSISWEDSDGDGRKELTICYRGVDKEGSFSEGRSVYTLDVLTCPDYRAN